MNFNVFYTKIIENFNVEEIFLEDILTTLEFRLEKNHYHYQNILTYFRENPELNQEKIYFESENLIINIRSTVDNLLQLINVLYKMNFEGMNINLKNIIRHKNFTNALRDVFLLHTHPKNQFWHFIYTTRNEVVHEICIKSFMPILIDDIYENEVLNKKIYFIDKNGDKEDLLFFYKQCIALIDDLCDKSLYAISNQYV